MKKRFQFRKKDGFTLIITIILMSMLTVLSIGLLTLGAVTLRGGTAAESKRTANANAQLALMLAIGELQKSLGSDKRVTADASILSPSGDPKDPQAHVVGVWTSENPYTTTTTSVSTIKAPEYNKDTSFMKWLVSSGTPSKTEKKTYISQGDASSGPVLFSTELDGYELRGESVQLASGNDVTGSYAWAVSQENTKAKINVGTDQDRSVGNDGLQAPTRPDLKAGGVLSQPETGWDKRNGKVVSIPQVILDSGYGVSKNNLPNVSPDYTASAMGVLADVAKGQLKTDLSLAFEMPYSSYQQSKWGDQDNPFALVRTNGAVDTPLYTPVTGSTGAPFTIPNTYLAQTTTSTLEPIYAGAPPTFGTLRSYYLLYRHLYNAGGSPAVYQRPQQSNYWNVALAGYNSQPPQAGNATSIGPVLDRMLLVMGLYVTPEGQVAVSVTPIITLWNPYNVSVEADGFVAYPYIDFPSYITFIKGSTKAGNYMSKIAGLGQGLRGAQDGRQVEPYFYCQITSDGNSSMSSPIRFAPGEVRIFQPASSSPVIFRRLQSTNPAVRTVKMMPANGTITSAKGGIVYPLKENLDGGDGMTVSKSDSVAMQVEFDVKGNITDPTSGYQYGIALEDSTRIANGFKNDKEKGAKLWSEVRVLPSPLANPIVVSSPIPAAGLTSTPFPVAVIETYHRTELSATNASLPVADLLLSTNIRQRYQHPRLIPSTSFANGTGPVYETHLRPLASFGALMEMQDGDGFYGMSNSANSGLTKLSLFDIPRDPPLSIGAFQHADLTDFSSASTYQFGNSWANPYIPLSTPGYTYRTLPNGDRFTPSLALHDTSYLTNAAVWDSYYLSSAAPVVTRGSGPGSRNNYSTGDASQVTEKTKLKEVISDWVEDPITHPLRNSRHLLHLGNSTKEELKSSLTDPKGAFDISAHILVDGAFNVNSTSLAAWESILSSARGDTFTTDSGNYNAGGQYSPISRLRYPTKPLSSGGPDKWNGFRQLSDSDIKELAKQIVAQVKLRGPFQSMANFVNRTINGSTDTSKVGAVQAAIDDSKINSAFSGASVGESTLALWSYSANFKRPVDVATAAPGWLTQADVLTQLAPFITVRSDTFIIRGYGEARDGDKITARSWCEATVQRVPEFVDPSDDPASTLDKLKPINTSFGRQFQIVAFRWVAPEEIEPTT